MHGRGLADQGDDRALRLVLVVAGHDVPNVRRYGAEIAALSGGEDLHHGGDVVLRNHRIGVRATNVGDASEHRGRRAGSIDGQILQRRQAVELVLRGLQCNRIGDPVLFVQPVRGRNLAGAREIDDQTVGDVRRGDAGILGARAVDIDVERRQPRRLLDTGVGDPGDVANLGQELIGIGEVRVEIVPADLHVDRRRCAEIQDLAHDVRRQKREGESRKAPRQLVTKAATYIAVGAWPWLSEIWMSPSDSPMVPVLL